MHLCIASRVGVFTMPKPHPRFARTTAMTARARGLRKQVSPIERKLWYALRADQLGASFRRQHPVGPYVLDVYCPSVRLAIELDGDDHTTRAESDSRRTRFLNQRGIRVVRFSNSDGWSNLEGVKEFIALELARKFPLKGGG